MTCYFRTSFLFFCCFTIHLFLSARSIELDGPQYFCNDGNFTESTIYSSISEENLDRLLSTLSSDFRGDIGFSNISYGEEPDKVNAIALCRADVEEASCRDCITNATRDVKDCCPNQMAANYFMDECMLRYSNKPIFGEVDISRGVMTTWGKNVSNPIQFNQVLTTLLDGLRDQAASGGPLLKFAKGNSTVSGLEYVNALMQCTPDLSETQCKDCLSAATGSMKTYCDGKKDCIVLTPSCNIRYRSFIIQFVQSPVVNLNTATRKGKIQGRFQILAILVATLFCYQSF